MQKIHKHKHHPVFTGIHVGAAALMALGMYGVTELTKFESHQAAITHAHESGEVAEDPSEGKKTLRMPINYTDGLRPTTISGA